MQTTRSYIIKGTMLYDNIAEMNSLQPNCRMYVMQFHSVMSSCDTNYFSSSIKTQFLGVLLAL